MTENTLHAQLLTCTSVDEAMELLQKIHEQHNFLVIDPGAFNSLNKSMPYYEVIVASDSGGSTKCQPEST